MSPQLALVPTVAPEKEVMRESYLGDSLSSIYDEVILANIDDRKSRDGEPLNRHDFYFEIVTAEEVYMVKAGKYFNDNNLSYNFNVATKEFGTLVQSIHLSGSDLDLGAKDPLSEKIKGVKGISVVDSKTYTNWVRVSGNAAHFRDLAAKAVA